MQGADGNSVFVRGGDFLVDMTDRALLDYHSVACSFILLYVTFDSSLFLYWDVGGLCFEFQTADRQTLLVSLVSCSSPSS